MSTCLICGKQAKNKRRALVRLCLKHERKVKGKRCKCTFLRYMGGGKWLCSNIDACPVHGFGEE